MAVVYTMTTPYITQGNTQVRYTITAETSGNDLIWKATPNAGKVLCYRVTNSGNYYQVYWTYGSNPVYFRIKAQPKNSNGVTSAQKTAIGNVAPGIDMPGKGWQPYSTTSEIASVTVTGAYTDFDVYILVSGGNSSDQTYKAISRTTDGGGVEPQPTPTPSEAAGVSVKVGDTWVAADAVYVKVDDTWIEADAVYVKVDDTWVQSTS